MMRNHLKQILFAGLGALAVLLVAGVPLARAVPYAVTLACPLMMIAMMWMMSRGAAASTKNRAPAADAMIPAPTAEDPHATAAASRPAHRPPVAVDREAHPLSSASRSCATSGTPEQPATVG
jgi:hypothetical protein